MSAVHAGRVAKHRRVRRYKSRAAVKMMAIMQDRNNEEVPKEFLETGRTGRRNAMPDILHPQGAEVTTADLPSRFSQLVTTDTQNPQTVQSADSADRKSVDSSTKKDSS